jgi:ADP-ribosylglycohydrolase
MNERYRYTPEENQQHLVEAKEKFHDRYDSILIGGALGDTLGMPVEGWSRDQIKKYVGFISEPINPVLVYDLAGNILQKDEYGNIPYISPHLEKGSITDDTWLSIATARSIIESDGLNLESVARHSVAVYDQQLKNLQNTDLSDFTNSNIDILPSFGGTTISAFENLKKGIAPTDSGVLSKNAGNGPVIKMAPVGMYMHATGKYEEGLQFAESVGKMTHLDSRSIVGGVLQAHAIYTLLNNVSRQEFLDSSVEVCEEWEKPHVRGKKVTLLERLRWVSENCDTDDEEAYQKLGVSWPVTKNYPFALFMFQKYWDNPHEGLLRTVNYGGDCDSTGAIVGALAGARNGEFYPKESVVAIHEHSEITDLANEIYNITK